MNGLSVTHFTMEDAEARATGVEYFCASDARYACVSVCVDVCIAHVNRNSCVCSVTIVACERLVTHVVVYWGDKGSDSCMLVCNMEM